MRFCVILNLVVSVGLGWIPGLAGAEPVDYSGENQNITCAASNSVVAFDLIDSTGGRDNVQLDISVYEVPLGPLIYSGANRSVTYSQTSSPGIFSLFGSTGTWDDVRFSLFVDPWGELGEEYRFMTVGQSGGSYIEFAASYNVWNVANLAAGAAIGPSRVYSGSEGGNGVMDFSYHYPVNGPFGPSHVTSGEFVNTTGYAGIRLVDGTNTFYGWIQISVENSDNSLITAKIIDWAYQSTPGTPILAGERGNADVAGYVYELKSSSQGESNHVSFAAGSPSAVAKRFAPGEIIGADSTFGENADVVFSSHSRTFQGAGTVEQGGFTNRSGYAGIRLTDSTNTYYGWIQLSVTNFNNAGITGTVIDWAHNTVAEMSIPAGATALTSEIGMAIPDGQVLEISWPTFTGVTYQLQHTELLESNGWTNSGPTIAGDGVPTVQVLPITHARGFYRYTVTVE